ncbi:DUF7696 family protein [Microvirga alba]|uniref:Uncharacterized protein n=1 Tax=Microvirga alba TaxID=2791025 RepID=A0A931BUU5_9HYPH|nr:hypothetical protein [Microvirga alba]MBF9235545.1 hypothetical protein [Microvirga alba]
MAEVDHRCLACGQVHPDAREVTLIDGTVVSSYSEAWRMECEARAVLAIPSVQKRREYLFGSIDRFGKPSGGVEQRRGRESALQLAEVVKRLWYAAKQSDAA